MTKKQRSSATTAALILAGAALIASCKGATGPGETTPPAVQSTSPANSSVGVLVNSVVTIKFSEAMDPTTIRGSTITLAPASGGATVSAIVSYDAPNQTATLTPTTPLDYGKSYNLTVTTGALDLAGNALAANYHTTFSSIQKLFDKPYFQGTNSISDATQPQIHVHIRFNQSGQSLSPPADCELLPLANCDLLPRNAAGLAVIGPLDDQGIAATITQISGTFTDPNISFTFSLANGRTFSFTGTVTNSETMTGTLTGPTLPPIQIILSRIPLPEP